MLGSGDIGNATAAVAALTGGAAELAVAVGNDVALGSTFPAAGWLIGACWRTTGLGAGVACALGIAAEGISSVGWSARCPADGTPGLTKNMVCGVGLITHVSSASSAGALRTKVVHAACWWIGTGWNPSGVGFWLGPFAAAGWLVCTCWRTALIGAWLACCGGWGCCAPFAAAAGMIIGACWCSTGLGVWLCGGWCGCATFAATGWLSGTCWGIAGLGVWLACCSGW